MRRKTTTQKLQQVITNNLLQITKAEIYYKTSRKTEIIDTDRFTEYFSFLCESGIFADAIGWHFERDFKSRGYIIECGRMNPDTEIIITVYLGVGEGVIGEKIEKILEVTEE
jgi:hypothetical protein